MNGLSVGSIVRCRNREWIILPSPDENLILLRPLTGSDKEVCGIYKPLANLGFDRVEPATFPLPTPQTPPIPICSVADGPPPSTNPTSYCR
jgi:hypothetical protein